MQPQFMTKPAFTVVGLLIHTKPMTLEIPKLWDQLVPRIGEIQHVAEPDVSYGLMDHFDQQIGALDYMAGNAVEKVVELPAGMIHWDVPANTYVVFEATIPTIGETFSPTNPVLSIYVPVEKKSQKGIKT